MTSAQGTQPHCRSRAPGRKRSGINKEHPLDAAHEQAAQEGVRHEHTELRGRGVRGVGYRFERDPGAESDEQPASSVTTPRDPRSRFWRAPAKTAPPSRP